MAQAAIVWSVHQCYSQTDMNLTLGNTIRFMQWLLEGNTVKFVTLLRPIQLLWCLTSSCIYQVRQYSDFDDAFAGDSLYHVLEKVESTLVEPPDDDTLEKNVAVNQVQSSECQFLGPIYAYIAVCCH